MSVEVWVVLDLNVALQISFICDSAKNAHALLLNPIKFTRAHLYTKIEMLTWSECGYIFSSHDFYVQ